MDRKEYLKLCQQNAIGEAMKKVRFDGIEFYPFAYQMTFDGKGNPQNVAILKDIKANSHTLAKLEKVEEL